MGKKACGCAVADTDLSISFRILGKARKHRRLEECAIDGNARLPNGIFVLAAQSIRQTWCLTEVFARDHGVQSSYGNRVINGKRHRVRRR